MGRWVLLLLNRLMHTITVVRTTRSTKAKAVTAKAMRAGCHELDGTVAM